MKRFFRYFFLFIVVFFLGAYFVVPKFSYEYLGGKEYIAQINPVMTNSDQPDIVRIDRDKKKIIRASSLDLYLGVVGDSLLSLPRLGVNYLNIDRFKTDIGEEFFGIFVDPFKNDSRFLLESLVELEVKSVGIRVYYSEDFFRSEDFSTLKSFLDDLMVHGFEPFIVIAQNFEAKRSSDLEPFFERFFAEFYPYAKEFQIGETINRMKWGIVQKGDYKRFFDSALSASRKYEDIKLVAPSVIDFEWYYTLYYLDEIGRENVDILNSLLYVDRRGWPENEQYGFDTIDKIELMKATDPNKPFWITEVNWPISGTDDYKPTSEDEAVSTKVYADYLVRYMLLGLSTSLVDRVYWWQLAAKGYGLIDHLNEERYEGFYAYKFLIETLQDASFVSKKEDRGFIEMFFEGSGGEEISVLWCEDECEYLKEHEKQINKQPNKTYYNVIGEEIDSPKIGTSPIYIK
ncbi:MAG: hypothetical protein ACLFQJ_05725 [Campylobacterales bacterium]